MMTITIVLLITALVFMLILNGVLTKGFTDFSGSSSEAVTIVAEVAKEVRAKMVKKVPLVIKKGDRGIVSYRIYRSLWKHSHPAYANMITKVGKSESRITVKAEVELIDVFGPQCSVKVISVHDHETSELAVKWLNHIDAHVDTSMVTWKTNNETLQLGDNEVIELYHSKKLSAGGVDIVYTGDSSPIELIDKLIV